MSEPAIRVAQLVPATRAEGPDCRWALWVQGCSIGCAGCCNPQTWDRGGGTTMSVEEVIASVLGAQVEGITLLGGEPFDQAVPLAAVAEAAQASGRGVMTFTGYRHEVLAGGGKPGWRALLAHTDLLVDGPFLQDRVDTTRPWVGSTNQRFIHLSDRYRSAVHDASDRVEVRIRRDGTVLVNGWPESALVEALEELVAEI